MRDDGQNLQRDAIWKQQLNRWGAYAAAAGAALAVATGADAEIVYSGAKEINVGPNSLKNISIGGKGLSFELSVYHGIIIASAATAHVQGQVPGGLRVIRNGATEGASLFAKGEAITGANLSYGGILRKKALLSGGTVSSLGHWGPGVVDAFMGVKLVSGTEKGDLGWIEVKVTPDSQGYPDEIQVLGWAYNDVSGGPINAGQTTDSSVPSATPEPGMAALSLLASGAAGLLALRRTRQAKAPAPPGQKGGL
jgi:hypothetical protein